MPISFRYARWSIGALLLTVAACNDSVGPSHSLTVRGSAGAPPAGTSATMLVRNSLLVGFDRTIPPGMLVGDPAQVNIGMYALYLSQNADCSAPVMVTDNGTTAVVKDFAANPVLFTGTPTAGTYRCVIFRMSDVVGFRSASTSAHCVPGTDYNIDIYRAPDTDWKDVNLGQITATGTDTVPSDDKVYIFATTDTAATNARGISPNQTILLTGTLTVPGSGTFYWDGSASITDDGTACGMQPPQLSFR